ncbi:MAG: hypothetical protein H0V65_08220 [Chitinophagales bacterium]|nr:hypothetical protein [Chitinophagales bacterium]
MVKSDMQIYNTNLINKFYLMLKIIAVFKMHQYNLSDQVKGNFTNCGDYTAGLRKQKHEKRI